jgi:hypothetical protein
LANDEVGEPAPVPVDEGRLIDDWRAVGHCALGVAGSDVPADFPRLANPNEARSERSEVSRLVLVALAPNQLSVRVVPVRLRELAARDSNLECRQVRTRDECAEV